MYTVNCKDNTTLGLLPWNGETREQEQKKYRCGGGAALRRCRDISLLWSRRRNHVGRANFPTWFSQSLFTSLSLSLSLLLSFPLSSSIGNVMWILAREHAIQRLSQLASGKMDKVRGIFHEAHNLTPEIDMGTLKEEETVTWEERLSLVKSWEKVK